MTIRELETYFNWGHSDLSKMSVEEIADYKDWLEAEYNEDTRYISLEEAWDLA